MPDHRYPPSPGAPGRGATRFKPLPDSIVVEPLNELHVEEAARLYVEVFLADEPTSRHIAPDPAGLLHCSRWYVGSLVKRGLSFIARDRLKDEITGFLFSFDFTDDFGDERERLGRYLSHFREAVAMIDELEMRYLNTSGILPGSVLHAFQGGVGRNYRKCGVFEVMMDSLVNRGRELGYRQIIGDCTNPASKKLLEQRGFHQAGYLAYDEFFIDGVRFFEGLKGGITLMVLDISRDHFG